ncbi:sensor histidine kinase [Marinobacter gelidimuriae]|uniref:sensor histidine kinase n=1 Tax=Marinobacter gelidimuriae TaxID=2739064 RepID=UPI000366EB30|nr:sensor histidine kinase [Marinobacter gelidimuriae]
MSTSAHKIRPAARLIKTIGQDLIKDTYAAIVELVKNAYDADSPSVVVEFDYKEDAQRLTIKVKDTGHGMTSDVVVNKWLVPATDDKLKRKISKNGRMLQGRKGIGRFSATILGDRILMDTSANGVTTSLLLDMTELENIDYLDELELNIDEQATDAPNGTSIEIEKENQTTEDIKNTWTKRQLRKLFAELRGLIAPEEIYQAAENQGFKIHHDKFKIILKFENFPVDDYHDRVIEVEPFPVLDLYDYKISGRVSPDGQAKLTFDNQNIPGLDEEVFQIKIPIEKNFGQKYPGEVFIDIRVYDRDPESIDNIIQRGLKDPDTNEYLGKQEARSILDEYYGIGVYREQFRIRPYGDQSFDWLDLDKKRVQNPSYKIGHNQVIGFVYIRPEEQSGLQEKSARDGLVENECYFGLLTISSKVINELEGRRANYRKKAFRGGRVRDIDNEIDDLFDFKSTQRRISQGLNELGVSGSQRQNIDKVVGSVLEEEKQKKSDYARKIRETIAIYQGQATLGKITHVLLHEGRKHIKYISETVPRITKWASELARNPNSELEERMHERATKTVSHAKGLTFLFNKIEPLARTRRAPKKEINLEKEIESAFTIFSEEISEKKINFKIISIKTELKIFANETDIITVFSNLIENSIFWLSQNNEGEKFIEVDILKEDQKIIVEYKDTGPGFQGGNLELMFEPGYSMKPDGVLGTGLGLSLAGDAMSRIGGRIEAKHSENGAFFELTFDGESK